MKLCAIQTPYAFTLADADAVVDFAVRELRACDASRDLILTPEYTNAPTVFPPGECIPYARNHTRALMDAAADAARRCDALVAVNHVREVAPGVFRNTTRVLDRSGHVTGDYDKQHMPHGERHVKKMNELRRNLLVQFKQRIESQKGPKTANQHPSHTAPALPLKTARRALLFGAARRCVLPFKTVPGLLLPNA